MWEVEGTTTHLDTILYMHSTTLITPILLVPNSPILIPCSLIPPYQFQLPGVDGLYLLKCSESSIDQGITEG